MRCPTCHRELDPLAPGLDEPKPDARYRPFCSERCKMVDLGRWVGEEYRVAGTERPSYEDDAEGLED